MFPLVGYESISSLLCWSGQFSVAAKDLCQYISLSSKTLLICSTAIKSMDAGAKLWGWYTDLTKLLAGWSWGSH